MAVKKCEEGYSSSDEIPFPEWSRIGRKYRELSRIKKRKPIFDAEMLSSSPRIMRFHINLTETFSR